MMNDLLRYCQENDIDITSISETDIRNFVIAQKLSHHTGMEKFAGDDNSDINALIKQIVNSIGRK